MVLMLRQSSAVLAWTLVKRRAYARGTTTLSGSGRVAVSEGVDFDPRGPQGVRRAHKSSAVPIIGDAK
jgi:hypothetical protein